MIPSSLKAWRIKVDYRFWVVLVLVLTCYGQPLFAATPKNQYLAADKAYTALKKRPSLQKYRDRWMGCIEKFQRVYAIDPSGSWAAAGLYRSALLYLELGRHSGLEKDTQTAIDTFGQVIREFPKSRYAAKSEKQLARLGKKAPPPSQSIVDKHVDKEDPLADLIEQNQGKNADKQAGPQVVSGDLATIQGLRFWSNPNYTRVVIDADRETSFYHRLLKKDPSLKKPQRLYIDMHKSRLEETSQRTIPINDELLSDVRAGQYKDDTVRIVVDIKSFENYKIFSLKNPFRVVLDVWGVASDRTASNSPMGSSNGKLSPGAIARQLALGVSRIVIDPGHGGRDYGAPGHYKGVHEKNIVLEIAKRLARKVESELKCDAILTRSTDRYLTLEERTAIANTQNADLFISIHTNAVRSAQAYGIETYFLNLATDDDAVLVAARENATSAKNISDLESILNDLMQNAKINESSRLAVMVQNEICQHLKKNYSHIRNKGVKKAPFYVLLGARMPSILVETAFISNPRECKRLESPKYQEALCDGIIEGIRNYIKETSPTAFLRAPEHPRKNG